MDTIPRPFRSTAASYAARSAAPPALLGAFQQGLPVRLIATPRSELATCHVDEPVGAVLARNREDYDFFPVTDGGVGAEERIVGLLDVASLRAEASPDGTAGQRMRPLCDHTLIGADASILAFLRDADTKPCRLLVSGLRIEGLVSLSDIQKLPVRAALFALITQAEMTMADAIRREFEGSSEWRARLSPDRREKLDGEITEAHAADRWVDDLLFTQFKDKVTILMRSPRFAFSKRAFEREMDAARKLRDNLAHANEYAVSRSAAEGVCKTVRHIETWTERLHAWPRDEQSAGAQ
ncbi:MAG: hypothetical protein IRY87_17995 [Acetobacteraceae bacterium]|nr:hypothetical protein [Acetobacteraceae bacterium]